MKLSDYSYLLPEERIADAPPEVRGTSRLLVVRRDTGVLTDSRYADIASFLEPGDLVVLNDTKVFKARLLATKDNGAERELIVLEKHGQEEDWHAHKILYRRTIRAGERLHIGDATIAVEKILGDGLAIVKSRSDLLTIAEQFGRVPLPPYMHREATSLDTARYQTVWASV